MLDASRKKENLEFTVFSDFHSRYSILTFISERWSLYSVLKKTESVIPTYGKYRPYLRYTAIRRPGRVLLQSSAKFIHLER